MLDDQDESSRNSSSVICSEKAEYILIIVVDSLNYLAKHAQKSSKVKN